MNKNHVSIHWDYSVTQCLRLSMIGCNTIHIASFSKFSSDCLWWRTSIFLHVVVHFKFNVIKFQKHSPSPPPPLCTPTPPLHFLASRALFNNTLALRLRQGPEILPVALVKATTALGELKETDFLLVAQIANTFQKYLQLWLMQIYN